MTVAELAEPRGDGRPVRRRDRRAHRRRRRGRAGSCRASPRRPGRGPPASPAVAGPPADPATASTSAAASDERQVADRGDHVVVGRGVHDDRPGPAGRAPATRPRRHRPSVAAAPGTSDPRPAGEQVRRRGAVAGRIAPGHRVTTDEAQADARRRGR